MWICKNFLKNLIRSSHSIVIHLAFLKYTFEGFIGRVVKTGQFIGEKEDLSKGGVVEKETCGAPEPLP